MNHIKPPVKHKQSSMKAFYAFMPMIIIGGINQLIVPSTMTMIMKNFGISTAIAGILPLIYFFGLLVASLITPHLINKYPVKKLYIISTSLVSASLLSASLMTNFPLFSSLFVFMGFGNGIIMILPGVYSTHHFSEEGAKLQSLIFSFMALGFVIGPVIPGVIDHFNMPWKLSYIIPAIIALPLLLPVLTSNHQPIENTSSLSLKIFMEVVSFDKRFFIGIMIICAVGAGSSSAINTWVITFMEDSRNVQPAYAHLILSGMGLATVLGRCIWGRVATNSSVFKTLVFISSMAMVLIFVAPIPNKLLINIILFILTVVFISGINPLSLSASSLYPKSHSSSVYSILFSTASVGGLFIPSLIGIIFHNFGETVGISSVSLLILIILISLLIIKKELPVSEHINRHLLP